MNGFKDHFSAQAGAYAEFRPGYPQELVDALAERAPGRGLAWDVGAGSGQFSKLLATRFEHVIATDASAAQLAHALPHARVGYRVEREVAASLAASSADLVAVAQAAHWFELARFYAEVRRVAKPGGVLALVADGNAELEPDLEPAFADFYGRTLGGDWPPERRHVLAGYRDVEFPFEELDLPTFELSAAWTVDEFLGYVSTWSAVASARRAGREGDLRDFDQRFRTLWGAVERRPIRWPLFVRAGRVIPGSPAGREG
ncbi:MAG: class I SAM-dependent methyltransferase [Planctomycetes bacterium]|nr:class I SAM-dependent methyltransferase [Planctomycetota bacterium]